ncbi:MAG: hypothetical protein ACE5JD_16065 [Candidatus Methylomirabilia bacterium]
MIAYIELPPGKNVEYPVTLSVKNGADLATATPLAVPIPGNIFVAEFELTLKNVSDILRVAETEVVKVKATRAPVEPLDLVELMSPESSRMATSSAAPMPC